MTRPAPSGHLPRRTSFGPYGHVLGHSVCQRIARECRVEERTGRIKLAISKDPERRSSPSAQLVQRELRRMVQEHERAPGIRKIPRAAMPGPPIPPVYSGGIVPSRYPSRMLETLWSGNTIVSNRSRKLPR